MSKEEHYEKLTCKKIYGTCGSFKNIKVTGNLRTVNCKCREKMEEMNVEELQTTKYRLVVDVDTDTVKIFNCETGDATDLIELPGDFKDEWNVCVGFVPMNVLYFNFNFCAFFLVNFLLFGA